MFATLALTICVAVLVFDQQWLVLPNLPLVVIGAALGIFVSFRTNSAYDRWWEGRKLWGRLVNTSRHFSTQVASYLQHADPAARSRLVHRQIAYVHTLRALLRRQDPFTDEHVLRSIPDDVESLRGQTNLTHALLQRHTDDLVALCANAPGGVGEFRLQNFDQSIAHLLDIQGGCERIKNTPMPRGYGFIAQRLTIAYAMLFPMGIVQHLGWATIPMNVLVCLAFALISEAGRVLEDPFTMFWNGLPLNALSLTIEGNLRQRLGETELVPVPQADEKYGVLM